MSAQVEVQLPSASSRGIDHYIEKTRGNKIKIASRHKSNTVIKITIMVLILLTIYAFFVFDYQGINIGQAILSALHSFKVVFLQPKATTYSIGTLAEALLLSVCMSFLCTALGAFVALFGSLVCAHNITKGLINTVARSLVSIIRAIPNIIWVLLFVVSAGLGSVAAIIGLTFHSAAYLTKAYADAIEQADVGAIEALRSNGAGFIQILTQGIYPSVFTYLLSWTFFRLEVNFVNVIAVGAAAGGGGIGYNLFVSGNFYMDLHQTGLITYVILISVIIFEQISTSIKSRVK
ncbi:MAG: ABC transporter permease subunit [Coriobacteriia bacterium]|nr:ABC transporter permease subunit [Coriobacteriia bacterium]